MAPAKIVKYFNEIKHNAETNKNDYNVNVSFLDQNNQKHVYAFCRGQDAIEGQARIDEPHMLQSSEAAGTHAAGAYAQGTQALGTQGTTGTQYSQQQQNPITYGTSQQYPAAG